MQTAVLTKYPVGIAGQLADLQSLENGDVVSCTNEEASAEIPFGVAVKRGTADDGVKKLTATTELLRGLTVFANTFDYPTERGDIGLKPGITFGVLRKGRMWVKVETNVTPASEVHVRAVAAGGEVAGAVRATADSTDCIEITPFASFETTALAGELAILNVDFDNVALATADS